MDQDFVQSPQAIDMEKYVLSAMLLQDGIAIPKAAAILSSDDFFYPEHQIIFSTMMQLYSQGTIPDILLIAEELRKSDMLEKIGGMTYLFSMSGLSPPLLSNLTPKLLKKKLSFAKLFLPLKLPLTTLKKALKLSRILFSILRKCWRI